MAAPVARASSLSTPPATSSEARAEALMIEIRAALKGLNEGELYRLGVEARERKFAAWESSASSLTTIARDLGSRDMARFADFSQRAIVTWKAYEGLSNELVRGTASGSSMASFAMGFLSMASFFGQEESGGDFAGAVMECFQALSRQIDQLHREIVDLRGEVRRGFEETWRQLAAMRSYVELAHGRTMARLDDLGAYSVRSTQQTIEEIRGVGAAIGDVLEEIATRPLTQTLQDIELHVPREGARPVPVDTLKKWARCLELNILRPVLQDRLTGKAWAEVLGEKLVVVCEKSDPCALVGLLAALCPEGLDPKDVGNLINMQWAENILPSYLIVRDLLHKAGVTWDKEGEILSQIRQRVEATERVSRALASRAGLETALQEKVTSAYAVVEEVVRTASSKCIYEMERDIYAHREQLLREGLAVYEEPLVWDKWGEWGDKSPYHRKKALPRTPEQVSRSKEEVLAQLTARIREHKSSAEAALLRELEFSPITLVDRCQPFAITTPICNWVYGRPRRSREEFAVPAMIPYEFTSEELSRLDCQAMRLGLAAERYGLGAICCEISVRKEVAGVVRKDAGGARGLVALKGDAVSVDIGLPITVVISINRQDSGVVKLAEVDYCLPFGSATCPIGVTQMSCHLSVEDMRVRMSDSFGERVIERVTESATAAQKTALDAKLAERFAALRDGVCNALLGATAIASRYAVATDNYKKACAAMIALKKLQGKSPLTYPREILNRDACITEAILVPLPSTAQTIGGGAAAGSMAISSDTTLKRPLDSVHETLEHIEMVRLLDVIRPAITAEVDSARAATELDKLKREFYEFRDEVKDSLDSLNRMIRAVAVRVGVGAGAAST